MFFDRNIISVFIFVDFFFSQNDRNFQQFILHSRLFNFLCWHGDANRSVHHSSFDMMYQNVYLVHTHTTPSPPQLFQHHRVTNDLCKHLGVWRILRKKWAKQQISQLKSMNHQSVAHDTEPITQEKTKLLQFSGNGEANNCNFSNHFCINKFSLFSFSFSLFLSSSLASPSDETSNQMSY